MLFGPHVARLVRLEEQTGHRATWQNAAARDDRVREIAQDDENASAVPDGALQLSKRDDGARSVPRSGPLELEATT
jgi:hypothetical protein